MAGMEVQDGITIRPMRCMLRYVLMCAFRRELTKLAAIDSESSLHI